MIRVSWFFCILLLFLSTTCQAETQLTIITEDFPPFNFTENGKPTGVTPKIVQEIQRRLGSKDTISVLPWARGYERLTTEPNVVLFTTARTKERESLFKWVGPLYCFRLGFYAKKMSIISRKSATRN